MNKEKRQKAQFLLSTVFQPHCLRRHHHRGRPPLHAHSQLWAPCCDGAESMTCLCVTAVWTVTVKRPSDWSPSWRLHPAASGASYNTGTTVQEGQLPQSFARLCRTATCGFCSSLPTSCRMIGAGIWCTRLWQRRRCPIGLSPWFRTCPASSILRNWSSTATLTWVLTLTEVTLSSKRLCSCVSNIWWMFVLFFLSWIYQILYLLLFSSLDLKGLVKNEETRTAPAMD